jgi:hypothetical protein
MDNKASNQGKLSSKEFKMDKREKKPLMAHVIQRSRQTLVLLFQCNIVPTYLGEALMTGYSRGSKDKF